MRTLERDATAYVWLMAASWKVAHAVLEDAPLADGAAPTACSPRPVPLDLGVDVEEPKCDNCVRILKAGCGSYAGYQRHRKEKTRICPACRRANTNYQRARRRRDPSLRDKDRAGEAARWRARLRLCTEYPDRYLELLAEERLREATS